MLNINTRNNLTVCKQICSNNSFKNKVTDKQSANKSNIDINRI